jgi:hypothetical protein
MRRALVVLFTLALLIAPGAQAWAWPAVGPPSMVWELSFNPADPQAPGQHHGIDVAARLGTIRTPDGYTAAVQRLGSIAVARGAAVRYGFVDPFERLRIEAP